MNCRDGMIGIQSLCSITNLCCPTPPPLLPSSPWPSPREHGCAIFPTRTTTSSHGRRPSPLERRAKQWSPPSPWERGRCWHAPPAPLVPPPPTKSLFLPPFGFEFMGKDEICWWGWGMNGREEMHVGVVPLKKPSTTRSWSDGHESGALRKTRACPVKK
jgi:hypothetical protein